MLAIAITLLISVASLAACAVSCSSIVRGLSAARSILAELESCPSDLRPANAPGASRQFSQRPACHRPARRHAYSLAA